MLFWIRLPLLLCFTLFGLGYFAGAAELESNPPSIFSTNLSSVSYVQKASQEWTLIIADQKFVTKIWIDGKFHKMIPKKTVIIKKNITFKKGKNTFLVVAENSQGLKAQQTFTVYYDDDLAKLEEFKNENLPPQDRPSAFFVSVLAGVRVASNAAHLPQKTPLPASFGNRQSSIQSGKLVLGYRIKPPKTSHMYQFQYSYFLENYENKTVAGVKLSDLGLNSHTLSAQYTLQQSRQAWSIIYALSFFRGNAKAKEDDQTPLDKGDNGNVATFNFLAPTYTRVHNEFFSSLVLLKLISRNFQKEPQDPNQDRDSGLSAGIDYNLFYYLPSKQGRLKGIVGYYQDAPEGKAQRFNQQNLGIDYSRNWEFAQKDSELQWQLGLYGRRTTYAEKYALTDNTREAEGEAPIQKKRLTNRQIGQTSLSWVYQSAFTFQLGYRQIQAFSSIDEFSFKDNVISLNFSWRSFF